MYNFNINQAPEYDLNASLIDETITLYGINCKFLFTQKLNKDDLVFGDYSSIKTDNTKIFSIFALPENTEEWESDGYNFSGFGMLNLENINMFISKITVEDILLTDFKAMFNNLLILPNNKIMEITDVQPCVPGVNNLFTYNNAKSVYKLTLKPYSVKLTDELDVKDIAMPIGDDTEDYTTLDSYFDELINVKEKQDNFAEIQPTVDTVHKTGNIDQVIKKPLQDNSEDDVFGGF